MADVEEACFTGLSLGLGVDGYCLGNSTKRPKIERRDEPCALSLGPYFSAYPEEEEGRGAVDRPVDVAGTAIAPRPRASKNRDSNSVATGNIDSSNLDGCRRKLRLSKDQSALLEDSFKIHRTLTPAQKQALADQLNLKPRQVEVWFQNRRARSKLKQIELDFERIKKKCDSLIHRNQRLEKELHDIRSMKDDRSSLSVQLPDPNPAAFVLCSSCQKIIDGTAGRN